jgi:outer membrane protein assembly factor BamB
MHPVVAGPHLFVRRLMLGPFTKPYGVATLVCLETATGKVEWSTTNHLKGRLHYVSDPLVIQDQIFALAEKQPLDGDRSLMLMIHHRANGRLLAERPIVSVYSSFDQQRSCQLTALEDGCLATVGGGVLCFDLAGNIRWARRPLWIPAQVDPHWLLQTHDPPLIVGDRCFVVQPGVLNLVCLAPESGRLHWQKAIAGLRRLTGLVGNRLVLQIDSGFLCLDAATGKERWRHDAPQLLSHPLCGGNTGLMYSASEAIPGDNKLRGVRLVWVDLETGRERTHFSLNTIRHAQPRLGPLFVAGDRLWAFSGNGNDLARDLIELAPKGPSLPTTPVPTEWETWTQTVSGSVRTSAARVLPGWTVFESKALEKVGLVAEFKGKSDVLRVTAPFCLARHLDVPAAGNPRLLLRVATEVKGPCLVAIDVEGERIWQQRVSSATTGDPWKDWEVDLSAYKGKRVWVVMRHLPRQIGGATFSYWSKIELVK